MRLSAQVNPFFETKLIKSMEHKVSRLIFKALHEAQLGSTDLIDPWHFQDFHKPLTEEKALDFHQDMR